MMTYEMMVARLEALGDDVSFYYDEATHELFVTVEDFAGFDARWREVERELDDEEAVDAFLEMLKAECVSYVRDFYSSYYFDGFSVELGYASYDI